MSATNRPDHAEPNDHDRTPTDRDLVDAVLNHGVARRSVMTALGLGALASVGAGSAAARHDSPHPPHIDPYYGYSAPADERLPMNLRPDHEVHLHVHPPAIVDGDITTLPFHFDPAGLHVDEGALVRFDFESPEHTITAYHPGLDRQRRVPDEAVAFSSPVVTTGGFWLYRFDAPGTYDLYCAPHEFFGMVLRLVVGDPGDPDYDGSVGPAAPIGPPRPPVSRSLLTAIGVPIWPFPTAEEVLATPALSVPNIVASGSVSNADVQADL